MVSQNFMAKKSNLTPSFSYVQKVGIIGAGLMGLEIAALNARNHFSVQIFDSNSAMLRTVRKRLKEELADIEDENQLQEMLDLVETGTLEELADCDLIIEAVVEKFEVKAALYETFKPFLRPNMIFTTNTSTIPIEKLSEVFPLPRNFAGFHFLHPVWNRELVEVIPSTRTSEAVLQRLSDYSLSLEKTPLCVCDCPGFVVNRLLQPYLNEALDFLLKGVSMESIEKAAVNFGMTWGPLRIMDEIGFDTVMNAGKTMLNAYADRVKVSPILLTMVKKKMLGRKAGGGFYLWGKDWRENVHSHDFQPEGFNPAAQEVIDYWKKTDETKYSLNEIGHQLAMAMADEAERILNDDVVSEQGQIDMAAVIGLAFPESKRGPLAWKYREMEKK